LAHKQLFFVSFFFFKFILKILSIEPRNKKDDNNIYCIGSSLIYYANERRGMKLITNTQNNDEICFQIDESLQTVDVNYEIAPLSPNAANSLASSIKYLSEKI